MSWLGVVGFGLMWGWLLGLLNRPPITRPFINSLVLLWLTSLLLIQTAWFNGRIALIPLTISIAVSFAIHTQLQQKFKRGASP